MQEGKLSIHGKNCNRDIMIGFEGKEYHTGKIAHVKYNGDANLEQQQEWAELIINAVNNYKELKETLQIANAALAGINKSIYDFESIRNRIESVLNKV